MAECNKQAVEEVKRNIESRKEFLQNEINNIRETISRLDMYLRTNDTLCEELDKITEIEYNGDVMSDEYKKEYYEFLNYAAAIKELELFNGYTKERAADVLAGQIKATADAIAFGLGLAASFAAPGLATVILTSAGFAVDAGTTAFCYAIGDDEEAQQRIVAMAMDGAFESLGAVSKYADDVADLTDDTLGSVYKNSLDDVDGFKGFDLSKDFDSLNYNKSFADLMTPEEAARYDAHWKWKSVEETAKFKNGTAYDGWYKSNGSINYPPNNGAVPGTEVDMTLNPGETLGRYGNIGEKSNFVTQTGADASKLALPPNTDSNIYQEFEVVKEIPKTIQSRVAPWGGSAGGGLQYELPMPILQLIKEGYIVPK